MDKNFRKELLISIGIGLGLLLLFFGGTLVLGSRMARSAASIQNLRKEIAFRNNAITSLVLLKNDAKKAESYQGKIASILPPAENLILLPKAIKTIGERNKVTVTFAFGSDTPGTATQAGSAEFQMTIEGLFGDIIRFLTDLESSGYLIHFDSVDMGESGKGYLVHLTGNVFSR
jgi:hypothetical protein